MHPVVEHDIIHTHAFCHGALWRGTEEKERKIRAQQRLQGRNTRGIGDEDHHNNIHLFGFEYINRI